MGVANNDRSILATVTIDMTFETNIVIRLSTINEVGLPNHFSR